MNQSTHYPSELSARERLGRQLEEELQRIKDACIQVAHIDPVTKPTRYEALVSAMMDALDRRVVLDRAGQEPQKHASQESDVFEGMVIEHGALDALVAHLRNMSLRDEQSSERYLVLSSYVDNKLARNVSDSPVDSHLASIDWEDLAKRMETLRERLYREFEEDRVRPRRKQ